MSCCSFGFVDCKKGGMFTSGFGRSGGPIKGPGGVSSVSISTSDSSGGVGEATRLGWVNCLSAFQINRMR